MPIWNPYAIDYDAGTDPFDPVTMIKYDDEQAKRLSPEVRAGLINKPRKIGKYVMTIDEAREANEKRIKNG